MCPGGARSEAPGNIQYEQGVVRLCFRTDQTGEEVVCVTEFEQRWKVVLKAVETGEIQSSPSVNTRPQRRSLSDYLS